MKNKIIKIVTLIIATFSINGVCAETFKRPPPIPIDTKELNFFVDEMIECMGVLAAAASVVADTKYLTKENMEMGRAAYDMVPLFNGFAYYSLMVGGTGNKLSSTYTDSYAKEVSKSMQAQGNNFRKKYMDGFLGVLSKKNDAASNKASEKYISCMKIIGGGKTDLIFNHTKKYEIYSPR